jgi:peptidoglycan/xylan/chitin deacetylase (PgdA/CDA1 family)
MRPSLAAVLLLASLWPCAGGRAFAASREVAITFDDLPGPTGALLGSDVASLRENTRKLLAAFRADHVPVVGFVNEGKLFVKDEGPPEVAARTAVLRMWTDAGFELGNHTYSHRSLNRQPLAEFEEDVVRGETVTRALLGEKGRTLRYFRHPFLQVGLDLDKRRAFEAFLAGRGYTVAPVTIDNDEYVYAFAYADARRRGDEAQAARLGADYLRYMETVFIFIEDVSQRLLGRQPRQVLLLHANALNAEMFGRLADMMKARGYRFISLERALQDEAYRRPDDYVGAWGISWLHHWELTSGRPRSPSPDPPDWVSKAYEAAAHR